MLQRNRNSQCLGSDSVEQDLDGLPVPEIQNPNSSGYHHDLLAGPRKHKNKVRTNLKMTGKSAQQRLDLKISLDFASRGSSPRKHKATTSPPTHQATRPPGHHQPTRPTPAHNPINSPAHNQPVSLGVGFGQVNDRTICVSLHFAAECRTQTESHAGGRWRQQIDSARRFGGAPRGACCLRLPARSLSTAEGSAISHLFFIVQHKLGS